MQFLPVLWCDQFQIEASGSCGSFQKSQPLLISGHPHICQLTVASLCTDNSIYIYIYSILACAMIKVDHIFLRCFSFDFRFSVLQKAAGCVSMQMMSCCGINAERDLTLFWYHDSASALLLLAMSSYWARTSATIASMSRFRLLSISTTTDVSLIWAWSSQISCQHQPRTTTNLEIVYHWRYPVSHSFGIFI